MHVYACTCVHACVHAYARMCVCAYVHAGVCACACAQVRMSVHARVYVCAHCVHVCMCIVRVLHACVHVCTHMCVRVCTRVCVRVCLLCACVCTCVHMCVCVHACARTLGGWGDLCSLAGAASQGGSEPQADIQMEPFHCIIQIFDSTHPHNPNKNTFYLACFFLTLNLGTESNLPFHIITLVGSAC